MDELMNILMEKQGLQAQKNVENNIMTWYEQTHIDYEKMDLVFPELSRSECEIATLILKGYGMKDVCNILGKKESNINCQRSNIRKKLQIPSGTDLRKGLLRRFI